jgi:hypothetical protein
VEDRRWNTQCQDYGVSSWKCQAGIEFFKVFHKNDVPSLGLVCGVEYFGVLREISENHGTT